MYVAGESKDVSLCEYYFKQYKIDIKDKNQFLFKVRTPRKMRGKPTSELYRKSTEGIHGTPRTTSDCSDSIFDSPKSSPRYPEVPEIEQFIYLVPELCIFDGLPEHLKGNRDLMQHCRKSVIERKDFLGEVISNLARSKQLGEWGLKIDKQPQQIKAQVLPPPTMIDGV